MKTPPFGLILVAAFAVGTGVNGFYTGRRTCRDAPNTLATMVSLFSLLMGIAGLAAAVLLWRAGSPRPGPRSLCGARRRSERATLAPRAYAPEDAGWPAAIIGGIMTAAAVVAIVLYTRWRLGLTARGESSPAS